MKFHDVIRHLVEHGPFASDTDRQEALDAVDEHPAASAWTTAPEAGEPDSTVLPEQDPTGPSSTPRSDTPSDDPAGSGGPGPDAPVVM